MKRQAQLIGLLCSIYTIGYAEIANNPCAGKDALLSIIDRPTAADSACVVPVNKAEIELGYQNLSFTQNQGSQYNLPQVETRFGLPFNTEFYAVLPNGYKQPGSSIGFSNPTAGLKHLLFYTSHWVVTAEAAIQLPSGSYMYGSAQSGVLANGILSYTWNQWNVSFMGGWKSVSLSPSAGNQRYSSLNPDLVLTYSLSDVWNVYAEAYGQSKTAPNQGWGSNFDTGLLYLANSYVVFDVSVGQRLDGNLFNLNRYIGFGVSLITP